MQAPLRYPAWLVDAEAPQEKRNSPQGYVRKFWGSSYEDAYAKAKAAAERAKEKVRASGKSPQDRFAIWSQGVCYNVSLDK